MIEEALDIDTGDGAMETFICRPDRGRHPAVLFLMDAPGIRLAFLRGPQGVSIELTERTQV